MSPIIVKNISIGDELLIGQVINTNTAWLGEQLSAHGFQLDSALTIGDSEKAILDAFDACMDADLVLVTGGLGPTADDITKPTVCKFFDTELTFLPSGLRQHHRPLQSSWLPDERAEQGTGHASQGLSVYPEYLWHRALHVVGEKRNGFRFHARRAV